MAESRTLDRREFTLAAALAALSGVVITISSACGKSNSSPTGPGTTDKVGVISNNHGHTAVITGAQLTAGGDVLLDIQGTATHTHSVSVTAAEIGMIAGSQQVAKQSSTNSSHAHTVTFN